MMPLPPHTTTSIDSAQDINELEKQLQALEKYTGTHITLLDHSGYFISPQGKRLLPLARHSHKSIAACHSAFCRKLCVNHCRHSLNAYFKNLPAIVASQPYIDTCWNSMIQLALPLVVEGRNEGTLFMGTWRTAEYAKTATLHKSLWQALPLANEQTLRELSQWMNLIANGIIHHITQAKNTIYSLNENTQFQVSALVHWVNQHLSDKVRLTDLAQWWGLSASHSSHKIKSLLGISFSDLIAQQRILRARALLGNTNLLLKEIATQLGYSDTFHFGKHFKKMTTQSPGKFRKDNNANSN